MWVTRAFRKGMLRVGTVGPAPHWAVLLVTLLQCAQLGAVCETDASQQRLSI